MRTQRMTENDRDNCAEVLNHVFFNQASQNGRSILCACRMIKWMRKRPMAQLVQRVSALSQNMTGCYRCYRGPGPLQGWHLRRRAVSVLLGFRHRHVAKILAGQARDGSSVRGCRDLKCHHPCHSVLSASNPGQIWRCLPTGVCGLRSDVGLRKKTCEYQPLLSWTSRNS